VQAVLRHKQEHGSLAGFKGVKEVSPEEVLEVDCDVLVPAALENSITLNNVGKVRARIIVELANGPTTPGADQVLFETGAFLVPDILANAGGVTVSYYEWVQNQYGYSWTEGQVQDTLESTMKKAFREVYSAAERHGVDMRTGAYVLAVGRVAEATSVRGIFP
jgi:glutamate dehydrogenase/leucine dehydrogenase